MTKTAPRHPFRVRKQSSGYASSVTYIVVKLQDGRASRVSVHAHHSRESAQMHADDLNIQEMVAPHADDPRPYAERLAEAKIKYQAEMAYKYGG